MVGILLLAIFTIGAACASDNVTDDSTAAVEKSDETVDVLSDGSYYDDDFYVTVQENYTHDKSEWESYDLIYMSSYSQQSGNFSVSVDNVEKLKIPVTDGVFSVEDDGNGSTYNKYYRTVYPTELGLDCGIYNIKIDFSGLSGSRTLLETTTSLSEKQDFDVWMQNPYYCEMDYWSSPSLIIIDSNHYNTGTMEIYVNGTQKLNYALVNGSFEGGRNDSTNRSKCIAPSDLFDTYGVYHVQINFTENGVTRTLRDEDVVIGEFAPTTDPKLEIYFEFYDLYLRSDVHAYIYLPREATGKLTMTLSNGEIIPINYINGYNCSYIHDYSLNHLGENEIIVKYVGEDFPTLNNVTGIINVHPGINIPNYANFNEEFSISMTVYDWVNGDFEIYDYNDGVKGNLIASNSITYGYSSVVLSSNTSGLNRYYLHIDTKGSGIYDIVKEVYVIKNSENITVDIPKEIEIGSNLTVTVYGPDTDWTFAQITADDGETSFVMLENGKAQLNISNLTLGYHNVNVFYENSYYSNGEWLREVYLNNFTVNVGVRTDIVASEYVSGENLTVTLTDADGNALKDMEIIVNVNGTVFNATTDSAGRASVAIVMIPGNYIANISFEGACGYLSSSATANVTIDKTNTTITACDVSMFYADGGNITAVLKDINGNPLVNKTVTVKLNGTDHQMTTDSNGEVTMAIDLTSGTYGAGIYFAGDESYSGSDKGISVTVKKYLTTFNGPVSINAIIDGRSDIQNIEVTLYRTNCDFVIYEGNQLPYKNVIFSINGKNTTRTTDGNGVVNFTVNLLPGNHTLVYAFLGDEGYVGCSDDRTFGVTKFYTGLTAENVVMNYGDEGELTVTLKDALGVGFENRTVFIELNGVTYERTTDENGNAKVAIDLAAGNYTADIVYKGDNVFMNSSTSVNVTVGKADTSLTAPDVYMVYGKYGELVVTLKDAKGNILANKTVSVSLNGQTLSNTTDSAGQIKVPITLPVGNYTADIAFSGDRNYSSTAQNANITVEDKFITQLEASNVATTYGSGDRLVVALKDIKGNAVEGKEIRISLGGSNFTETTDSNGQVSIVIDLNPNSYVAEISFAGDDDYKASSATANVTIDKINTTITAYDVSMYYADGGNITAALKDINGNPMVNKTVTVNLNGTDYEMSTDSNGEVSMAIDLPSGTYGAGIYFAGDEWYSYSHKSISVTVKKYLTKFVDISSISVKIDGRSYVQTIEVYLRATGCDFAITEGIPLPYKNVIFSIDGTNTTRTTDGNGVVNFTVNLLPGNHTLVYTFLGDEGYVGCSDDRTFGVTKFYTGLTAENVVMSYGDERNLTVTLKDALGVGFENRTVFINLNGVTYERTTDENGNAQVAIDLAAGNYTADIVYKGDNVFMNSSANVTVVVNKIRTTLTAPQVSTTYNIAKDLVITLKGADNKALSGKTVTFKLNNVVYKKATDKNGQVRVSVNLPAKTYSTTISFAGDDICLKSSVNTKVVVAKASPKITAKAKTFKAKAKTKKYSITLKNNKDKVMKKAKVTLKVKGKTFKATTNSKGKATFKITKFTKKGTFKAKISYGGDNNYKAVSKTVNIKVKK
jgi:hypothetical protein